MINVKVVSFYNWNNTITAYTNNFVEASEIDTLKNPIEKLTASGKVEDTDAVFFHTTSKIPRYKFSNYCTGKNTKRVINIDKATACVLSLKTLKAGLSNAGFSRSHRYYDVPYKVWADSGLKMHQSPGYNIQEGERSICDPTVYQSMQKVGKFPDPRNFIVCTYYHAYGGAAGTTAALNGLGDIDAIIRKGIKLVDDDTLNKQMAEGAFVVNEENYDELSNMLSAKDEATVITGLELLANSDYVNSQFYIGLLLNRYKDILGKYGSRGVNLKNFFEYFRVIQWNSERHQFLGALRRNLRSAELLDNVKDKFIRSELLQYANDILRAARIRTDRIFFEDEKIEVAT